MSLAILDGTIAHRMEETLSSAPAEQLTALATVKKIAGIALSIFDAITAECGGFLGTVGLLLSGAVLLSAGLGVAFSPAVIAVAALVAVASIALFVRFLMLQGRDEQSPTVEAQQTPAPQPGMPVIAAHPPQPERSE